jgi:hypothetical protein
VTTRRRPSTYATVGFPPGAFAITAGPLVVATISARAIEGRRPATTATAAGRVNLT